MCAAGVGGGSRRNLRAPGGTCAPPARRGSRAVLTAVPAFGSAGPGVAASGRVVGGSAGAVRPREAALRARGPAAGWPRLATAGGARGPAGSRGRSSTKNKRWRLFTRLNNRSRNLSPNRGEARVVGEHCTVANFDLYVKYFMFTYLNTEKAKGDVVIFIWPVIAYVV